MSKIIIPRKRALLAAPAIVHMAAYANTLTTMIPTLNRVVDVVSRELTGFIPSVSLNVNGDERAALNQTISWHKSGTFTTADTNVGMTVSAASDRAPGQGTMTISKSKQVGFNMTGEEQRALNSPGAVGVAALAQSDFAQALRALVNEVENDLAVEAYKSASRAYGTAGTTPFASTIAGTAQVRKILDDNGAPGQRSLIINTDTAANMRTLGHLNKVNEAGDAMTLRQGELDNMHGFSIKESGCSTFSTGHTKGTASGATTNNAGYAVGATTITLASAGTGTIVAGDVITFAGDANQYVVVSGDADVSGGGTITIGAPGLRKAIAASATNITVVNSYAVNVAFAQSAMRLLARAPAVPTEGDARIDEYLLTDPRTGLQFEVSVWAGQRMVKYEVALAWGVAATNEDHIALLIG